jgi:hypothetical protein
MNTTDTFTYALLDENNVVINIAVFDNQDENLIQAITQANHAVRAILCNEFGEAVAGGIWNGERFLDLDGNKLPLSLRPVSEDKVYIYSYEKESWNALPESVAEKLK